MWTGYIHSVCKGSHPLKSEVRMLPILDLNSSDMTSVKSVLAFVSKQAQALNLPSALVNILLRSIVPDHRNVGNAVTGGKLCG